MCIRAKIADENNKNKEAIKEKELKEIDKINKRYIHMKVNENELLFEGSENFINATEKYIEKNIYGNSDKDEGK